MKKLLAFLFVIVVAACWLSAPLAVRGFQPPPEELLIGNLPLTDDRHGALFSPCDGSGNNQGGGWGPGFVMTETKELTTFKFRMRLSGSMFANRQWPLTLVFIEDKNPTAADGPWLGPKHDGSFVGAEVTIAPNEAAVDQSGCLKCATTYTQPLPAGIVLQSGRRYWATLQNRKCAPFKQWFITEWFHQTVQVHASGPSATYNDMAVPGGFGTDMRSSSTTPFPTYIPDTPHVSDVGFALYGKTP